MSSDKNLAPKLPDGWMLCTSKSNPGRKYYFNKKTGKSSWTQPQADEEINKTLLSKQKIKERKKQIVERRKEEMQKKNMKRKSNSIESSPSKKRQKEDGRQSVTPVDQECKHEQIKKPSPTKKITERPFKRLEEKIDERIKKLETASRNTPIKNTANLRLSRLRESLNTEVMNHNDEEKSPNKNKLKISPTTQIEPPAKNSKLDLKSPNLNESKCSTTQSPSSDSIQSMPSPSQFFAANKIISSIKAQLPEEFSDKAKQKDTFAAIEEGICNQITEYPYMKHPATPPQFSEASKLMSAIKSKLTCKVVSRDVTMKTFSSAKERMESLRARLSSEPETEVCKAITDEEYLSRIELPPSEAMDVDCKEIKDNGPSNQSLKDTLASKENIVLVVDTNIFIHELDVIKNVINSHIKGYTEQPTLLVPWRVINELDRLKDNNNGNGAICKRARSAMDYLYKSLPENNRIKGQSLRDSNSHIYPCESPDDEILNCCLQQAERGKSVILLSNDKNLCNKASINGVRCIGLDELKPLLENKPQPTADPDLLASVKHYESTMYQLLANILENEMRAKYNNLWQHVLFKAPPWSFSDVVQCLLKHWFAVFSEVFPRIEHLLTDLKNAVTSIEGKDPKSLSQSEVSNFKELCLEIAKKCQIIPEYMELAKTTVEKLQRKCTSETKDAQNTSGGEMAVIDAFEGLWTVFSSYCAKLASALNIPHKLEDKLPSDDSLADLTSKWPLFNSQLRELSSAMQGLLNMPPGEPSIEEQVAQLEIVFKESLAIISYDGASIHTRNMAVFATNCRSMVAEACTKFSELAELLDVCRNVLANQ